MEKKSTVITPKGYTIKVADHMLNDLAKFGATTQRPVLKPTPKEILNMPKKVIASESNLPTIETTAIPVDLTKVEPIQIGEIEPGVIGFVKKVRKPPVRSKSKA